VRPAVYQSPSQAHADRGDTTRPVYFRPVPTLAAGALCLAALAGGAWLVGRVLLPAGLCRGRVEEVALGGALGFVVVGQLDFLLRLCGWRLPPAALVLLPVLALATSLMRRRRGAALATTTTAMAASTAVAASNDSGASPLNGAGFDGAAARLAPLAPLGVLLLVGGGPLALLALYPAVDPDPGIYHLPFARAFVQGSGLPFLADLRFPVFPQLNELLFAIGLRLHGTTGAHLVEVALALCAAMLLWVWGRDVGGTVAGAVAAALWLGNPLVVLLGSTAHVDVGVACFVLAGLYCLERARVDGGGRGRVAWPAMAGTFLGGAAAVKYMGLFFLAAGGLAVAVRRRLVAAFAVAALVVVVPVYGHILRLTGNPIFPFFPQVFGFTDWTHDQGLRAEQVRPIPVPWTRATLAAMARFPAQRAAALFAGGAAKLDELARADRDPPHIRALRRLPGWGRSLVLAALAATWVRALWRPQLRLAVAVALASLVVWLSTFEDVQRLDPRYILAAGPPLALATGAALAELVAAARRTVRRLAPGLSPARFAVQSAARTCAAALLALAVVAPGLVFARARARYLGPLPLNAAARLEVARAHLAGFDALREVARRHGRASAVYNLDLAHLAYYAPGRYLGDAFGPQRYSKLNPSFGSGQALYDALRGFGADHLLAPRNHLVALPRDATFAQHFRVEQEDAGAVLWELQPLATVPATGPPG
jgi:4-amino-4-deoxy-L-arabinose transferase-like glycosyltransferase